MAALHRDRITVDLRLLVAAATILALLLLADAASAVERVQRTGMFNGPVRAISEPDANGIRYLGGGFTRFNSWATGASTAVDATTGAVDPSFPKVEPAGSDAAVVFDAEPDGNGGVFIAGEFGLVDGQTRYGLAHVLADGSVDPAWTAGLDAGSGSWIYDIELAGGVLYVVGKFSGVADAPGGTVTTRYDAAAFDAGTGVVTTWNPAAPTASAVTSIAVDAGGGQAFLGGNFTCVNARPTGACGDAGAISRLAVAAVNLTDGAATAFDASLSGGAVVETLELDSTNSWLYLGGAFTTVRSQARTNAAVISADGNTVGTWAPNPSGSDARVFDFAISGSTIYLGGRFTSVRSGGSPTARENLAAVSADPNATAVATPLSVGFDGFGAEDVQAVAVRDGNLYVGGSFAEVDGSTRDCAVKLSLAGAVDAWDPGIDSGGQTTVYAFGTFGSEMLIGGRFTQAGGEVRNRAAAVDGDGYLTDWSVTLNRDVNAVAVADGKVFLGGAFTRANGQPRNRAAAFSADGTLDPNWNPDLDAAMYAMTVVGSTVYVGGDFRHASGAVRNFAAAFDISGVLGSWDPDLDSTVFAMSTEGSTVFLGGFFTQASASSTPVTRNYAAAFSTSGGLLAWDPDLDSGVLAMTVFGSTVYLGGFFEVAAATPRYRAAAFTTTGTLDPNWAPDLTGRGNGVFAMAALGSTVYVGGSFDQALFTSAAVTRSNAAAFSTSGALLNWNPNVGGDVLAVAAAGSTVYLGGSFTSVGGAARSYSAAVSADGTLLDPWPRVGAPTSYTLTVTRQGGGSGTVTSSPAGIDCGATCTTSVRAGRTVTLTAAPAAGSTFVGWGGACSGTGTTCAVTMDQARSVTAEFTASSSEPSKKTRSSLRVLTASGQGREVVMRLRVSGPGRVSAVGTVAGSRARVSRTTVCTAAKQVRKAGVVRLICRINARGRSLQMAGPLRIRLAITYVPRRGATRTATRVVRLAQSGGVPEPVTG